MDLKRRIVNSLSSRGGHQTFDYAGRCGAGELAGLSGAQTLQAALSLGGALAALMEDTAPRRAVIVLPAGLSFVVTLLACVFADITVIPVAIPRQGRLSDRLRRQVRDCGAPLVLTNGALGPMVRHCLFEAGECAPWTGRVQVVEALSGDTPLTAEQVVGTLSPPEHPVIVQFTSGSGRFPRGVRISGANILANCDRVRRIWGMNSDTVMVNWLPHYHDMGLMGGIFYPLLSGGRSIQMSPLDVVQRPLRWLQAISDYQANFSGGPTFGFARCLDGIGDEQCEGLDLSSWRVAYCGAEPVHAGTLRRFRERFAPYGLRPHAVHACYGMAEYTLLAAGQALAPGINPPIGHPDRKEDLGLETAIEPCFLAPEMAETLRIVDPQSRQVCRPGQDGEIWLRGPSKASGYDNLAGNGASPDKASQATESENATIFHARLADDGGLADGDAWLRTGDLGTVRGDFLYVTGRLKDVVTVRGQKVSAPEIEWRAAACHPALNAMAAAAFMPDVLATGQAVLMIEKRSNRDRIDREEGVITAIRRAVLGEWGIELTDIRVLRRGELARTTSGKIRRALIAETYRRQGGGVRSGEGAKTKVS